MVCHRSHSPGSQATACEPLCDLDEVAYLRYASVYRGFESLDDFEKEGTDGESEGDLCGRQRASSWSGRGGRCRAGDVRGGGSAGHSERVLSALAGLLLALALLMVALRRS
jgi:hypothetical protein